MLLFLCNCKSRKSYLSWWDRTILFLLYLVLLSIILQMLFEQTIGIDIVVKTWNKLFQVEFLNYSFYMHVTQGVIVLLTLSS